MHSEGLHLLSTKRFFPLFLCQFLSALKHNFLRTVLVASITFKSATLPDFWRVLLVSLSFGIGSLPYIIFSAIAGELSDKYDKAKLIYAIKAFDLLFTFFIIIGILVDHYTLILLGTFLTGCEAAVLGPVKYSILPEHLSPKELVIGNGLIEASTFVAILLGIILGGLLYGNNYPVFLLLLFTATSAYFLSKAIPPTKPALPTLNTNQNVFIRSLKVLNMVIKNKKIFKLIILISWFWLEGGIFLAQMPNLTKDILNSDNTVFVMLLTVFTCGVALGSIIFYKILPQKLQIKYSLYSLFIASIFIVLLYHSINSFTIGANIINFREFISVVSGIFICFNLFFLAVFYGIFIVPIYVLLQVTPKNTERSRVVAGNNIINSIFIVFGSLVSAFLLGVGIKVQNLFLILAIVNLFIIYYGYSKN